MEELEVIQKPQILSPSNSTRRRSNDSNSPEFEFWMLRNPSFPQQNLLSADELFSGGVLLPLRQLHHQPATAPPDLNNPPPPPPTPQELEAFPPPPASGSARPAPESGPGPELSTALSNLSASAFTSSKRWKDIFKKIDRKNSRNGEDENSNYKEREKDKDREKKREKKSPVAINGGGNNGATAAELNINIWPFRRSRSAGNGGGRPRISTAAATRKVSSAPCSRSNSAGESKSRKWPSSPSRGGVHLGRTSPVWQVRRGGGGGGSGGSSSQSSDAFLKNAEKGVKKYGNEARRKTSPAVHGGQTGGVGQKARVLNLNVPMCIGYRHHLSCRSDENSAVSVAAAAAGGGGGGGQSGGAGSGEGVRGSNNLFNIRSLFTKRVY